MRTSEKDLPVLTTVNVVTQEKKIGWCKGDPHTPQGFFEAYQVAEVAMDITYKKSWFLIISNSIFKIRRRCLSVCFLNFLVKTQVYRNKRSRIYRNFRFRDFT